MAGGTLSKLTTPWRIYPSAAEPSRLTPAGRDRVVDLVRGASLLVVVFGHPFMAAVRFTDDGLRPSCWASPRSCSGSSGRTCSSSRCGERPPW